MVKAQKVKIVDTEQLLGTIHSQNEKVHIINFFASWCAPCVKEIPYFEEVRKNNKEVEMTFVSIDFQEDLHTKLLPLIKRKKMEADVILMKNTDYNSWIDKVEKRWEGSIPMTLIIDKRKGRENKRYFFNRPFSEKELYKTIHDILN